jgi:hypothetical protein
MTDSNDSKALVPAQHGMPANTGGLGEFANRGNSDFDPLRLNGKVGKIFGGTQSEEIKPGTAFAFFIWQVQEGMQLWEGGQLIDERWRLAADPDAPSLREMRAEMPRTNPDEWKEFLPSGLPKDPVKESVKMPAVNPATGRLYTYSTGTSWHAVQAVRRMVKSCLVQQKAAPETTNYHVPLIEFGVRSKSTPNGLIYIPVFGLPLDWLPIGVVLQSLAKTGSAALLGLSEDEVRNADLGDEPAVEPSQKPAPKKGGVRFA